MRTRTLFLAAVAASAGLATAAEEVFDIPLDPATTYLRTSPDDPAFATAAIPLSTLPVVPGCIIRLEPLGDFSYTDAGGEKGSGYIGIFSMSGNLLPNAELDRLGTNKVPSGLPEFTTARSIRDGVETDIESDFAIFGAVEVAIPEDAQYLFVASHDEYYSDNVDTDAVPDYGIRITVLSPVLVITEDTYIGPDDHTMDGTKLTVGNATLTIDGQHQFQSIDVLSGGIITHTQGFDNGVIQGFELLVVDDVTVDLGGSISVSSRGYLGDEGPGAGTAGASYGGGGGHGGEGGRGANGANSEGGISYGSITQPTDFGSGGAQDVDNLYAGRRGGGAIRLDVGGTLTVNGFIDANGDGWRSDSASPGAGAGGSIWIDAGAVSGTTGQIRAVGASSLWNNGTDGYGGGGSGGRIAIYTDSLILDAERIHAYGGTGYSSGESGGDAAAGTIYIAETGSTPTLIIDNDDVSTSPRITTLRSPLVLDANLILRDSGRFGAPQGMPFDASFSGDVDVEVGALISVSQRGYLGDEGPGAGTAGASYGGGGGHGGEGGRGANGANSEGGISYGSITQPTDFGSGGAQDVDNLYAGRRGGGAIRLDVGGTLTVNGFIDANGDGWRSDSASPGAGAGGSIWIDAGAVSGTTGQIRAVGASSLWNNGTDGYGGGGSGGRIAIYTDSLILDAERIHAYGGTGYSSGESGGDAAAGTIYIAEAGSTPTLIIDNDSVSSSARITMLPPDQIITGNVIVRDKARLGVERGLGFVAWHITGDFSVESGCDIYAASRGFGPESGPGAGEPGLNWGGGGGHGGDGGDGRGDDPFALGGLAYGSDVFPVTLGSGGAHDPNTGVGGGAGGGALWIRVDGELSLRGNINAGGAGGNADQAGGGAGGSILIEASIVSGIATITAPGGSGISVGGGGGGGRIAIYTCDLDPRLQILTEGGGSSGGQTGQPGSIVTAAAGFAVEPEPVEADNGGNAMFSVAALGLDLMYQWQYDGVDLIDGATGTGSVIAGALTDTLAVSGISSADQGAYRCVLVTSCGDVASGDAALTVSCSADMNGDGILDFFDVSAFLAAFSAGEAVGDFNGDGLWDFFDVSSFLAAFSAGCP
jgi:hypothetical protein